MSEGWSRETKVAMDFLEKTIGDELQTRQLRTEISSFLLKPASKLPCLKAKVQDKKTLLHILSSSSSPFLFF